MSRDLRSSDTRELLGHELNYIDNENVDDDFYLGSVHSGSSVSLLDFSSGSGEEYHPNWNDLNTSDKDEDVVEPKGNIVSVPANLTVGEPSTSTSRPKKKHIQFAMDHSIPP